MKNRNLIAGGIALILLVILGGLVALRAWQYAGAGGSASLTLIGLTLAKLRFGATYRSIP